MLSYIRDVDTPKTAWDNVKRLFIASTTTEQLASFSYDKR